MAAFALYMLMITAGIALAALLVEYALATLRLPRRMAWLTAMVIALVAPVLMSKIDRAPPQVISIEMDATPDLGTGSAIAWQSESATIRSTERLANSLFSWPSMPSLDRLLTYVWIASSCITGFFFIQSWLSMRSRLGKSRSITLHGARALLSDDIGPAVFGFWSPHIVLPRWLINGDHSALQQVLAHESEHLRARDQLLLLGALLIVVVAPWNAGLWWMLRRLRFALEVDCDARVVRNGTDATTYAETLLFVGKHQKAIPAISVALLDPPSVLERRIQSMFRAPSRYSIAIAIACSTLGATLVLAATQIEPPTASSVILLPPPASGGFNTRAEAAIVGHFPELHTQPLNSPLLLNVLLNNDFSIDVAEKKAFPVGTSLDSASPPDTPNNGFDAARLNPADARWGGRIVWQSAAPSLQPVFVNFAVRGLSKSRSASVVQPQIRKKYPDLFDKHAGQTVVTAFFGDDGRLLYSSREQSTPIETLLSRDQQLDGLTKLKVRKTDVGTTAVIPGSNVEPYRPIILYGFARSSDPRVDNHPLNPASSLDASLEKELLDRHFAAATDSLQPHQLLWIALDQQGAVMRVGQTSANPEEFASAIERIIPGAMTTARRTKPVGDLYGRKILDAEGQPLMVSFLWTTRKAREAADNSVTALVQADVYRNNVLVSSEPIQARASAPQLTAVGDSLRFELAARPVGDQIELQLKVQARNRSGALDFAEHWETAAEPAIRTRYDSEGVIEFGIQYPGETTSTVWRIVLMPRKVTA